MTCAVNFTVCQEITLRLQKEVFILSLIDAVSLSLLIVFLSSSSHIFTWVTDWIRFRRIVSLGHLVLSEQRWKLSRYSFTGSTCIIWTTMEAFKGKFHWVTLYDLNNNTRFQRTVSLGQLVWSEQRHEIPRDTFSESACMRDTLLDTLRHFHWVSLYQLKDSLSVNWSIDEPCMRHSKDSFAESTVGQFRRVSLCELSNSLVGSMGHRKTASPSEHVLITEQP